uniref:Uncharacterized protein n=1 Tax=Arundo donax TaxID=35708 RepID=A0A0A9FQL2_ARUDO
MLFSCSRLYESAAPLGRLEAALSVVSS